MSDAPVSRRVYKFAVFALAIGAFAIGVTEFATMGLLPHIARELGITVPQAGHAVSFYAIGVVVGAPLITTIAAHMDRKLLLLCLMGLFALGNLASMLAPDATLFNIARFFSGLPTAPTWASAPSSRPRSWHPTVAAEPWPASCWA